MPTDRPGYEIEHGGKLATVFSAPNYCDQMGNKGAYIRLDGKTMTWGARGLLGHCF